MAFVCSLYQTSNECLRLPMFSINRKYCEFTVKQKKLQFWWTKALFNALLIKELNSLHIFHHLLTRRVSNFSYSKSIFIFNCIYLLLKTNQLKVTLSIHRFVVFYTHCLRYFSIYSPFFSLFSRFYFFAILHSLQILTNHYFNHTNICTVNLNSIFNKYTDEKYR